MPGHDIVVIGGSAGGLEALIKVVGGLTREMAATLFVAEHVSRYAKSLLPSILSRRGPLEAAHAENRQPFEQGRIYVAPPDHHLLVRHGKTVLSQGPAENGNRPSIDPLFRSAAMTYGPRVVGVVLSGVLDDGSSGLSVIEEFGGKAIVQDPEEAMYPDMPANALENVPKARVLPASEIGAALVELAAKEVDSSALAAWEERVAAMRNHPGQRSNDQSAPVAEDGAVSSYTCPDCGGSLWEVVEGAVPRYRCRVGHTFSEQSLLAEQSTSLEGALWAALRALEEKDDMLRRMTTRARRDKRLISAEHFERQTVENQERIRLLQSALQGGAIEQR
jgi:two-component system chemotaxis response regulator CheB